MKQQDPAHDITVVERNRPYDTFGWGVVFSDQTLGNLQAADPTTAAQILDAFNHWDDIEVNIRGQQDPLGRPRLLRHRPQAPAQHPAGALRGARRQAGVRDRRAGRRRSYADADLDHRQRRPEQPHPHAGTPTTYRPDIDLRDCRFVWLGTHKLFEAFTFAFEETEHGWFQAHAYRFDDETSTFIVEAPEEVWRAAGLDTMEKEEAIAFCEKLFAKYLDGHALMSNAAHLRGSAQWIRFPRVVCERWVHHNGPTADAGRADGRRRAHRALLDRLGHQARAGGRDRAGALHRQRARRPATRALQRLRGGAQRRGAEDPERGAQLDRVVRERRRATSTCRPSSSPIRC